MVTRWLMLCASMVPWMSGCAFIAGIEQDSYLLDGGESFATGAGGSGSAGGTGGSAAYLGGAGGSGGTKPKGDAAAPVGDGPWCNNSFCDWSEDKETCAVDCPPYTCGNHSCEAGEDVAKCPEDCGEPAKCGNTLCETSLGETGYNCGEDCAGADAGGD